MDGTYTIRVSVAHINELQADNAALRRQVDELRQAMETLERASADLIWGKHRSILEEQKAEENVSDAIEHARAILRRAALARVGGECETCEHLQLPAGGGGHCYMFKEKPVRQCMQWRPAREEVTG